MTNLLLTVLISSFTVTAYRSVPNQTDCTPYVTSIGERVNIHGIAIHPSLLCPVAKIVDGKQFRLCQRNEVGCNPTKLHYHDAVYVDQVGIKFVNDVMNEKTAMNSKVDVWVESLQDERRFYRKFKNKTLKVWLIKEKSNVQETKKH